MASRFDDKQLDKMADNLRTEVAEQYNMSVQEYFSQLASVSLRPLNADKRNESEKGEEDGEEVEISSGVTWTLVAPLILLVVLVIVGVTVACLWRLKDRRCRRGETSAQAEEQGQDVDEIELQEFHKEVAQNVPEPAARRSPGASDPFRGPLQHDPMPSRSRYTSEGEGRRHPRQCHEGLPGARGIQDQMGIQLLRQEERGGPEEEKPAQGQGGPNGHHKTSVENRAHVKVFGEAPQDLYCSICQNYMAQCYQHNAYYHTTQHHHHPQNSHQDQHLQYPNNVASTHAHGVVKEPFQHCQQCIVLRASGHHGQVVSQSHESSLHHAHAAEKDHRRQVSQPLDDHLQLVLRYQPPHPAAFHPQANLHLQDRVNQDLLQHHQDTHDLMNPSLNASAHSRGAYHGLENPLFALDGEHEALVFSGTPREVSAGKSHSRRGKEERGPRRSEAPHIINSTSMMSTYGGDSDPTHFSPGRHARRHSIAHGGKKSAAVKGPDISSIKMPSSTSQAWPRASCRRLPSSTIISSSETRSYHSSSTHTPNDDTHGDEDEEEEGQEETLSLPSSISRFHASRVQFPPLMPDAQYPLTSTKAFYSPSWLGQSSKGEGQGPSGDGNILEALENFSDNTSMQPNVGSSVTSGQMSDIRGSQTVSSSVSDPWGAPMDIRPPPPSPSHLSSKEAACNEADQECRRDPEHNDKIHNPKEIFEGDHSEKVANQKNHVFGDGAEGQNGAKRADKQSVDKVTADSDSSDAGPRVRAGTSEASSPRVPNSASELHRARILRGKKRQERVKSEQKRGFFLIPKQETKIETNPQTHQAAGKTFDVGMKQQGMSSPQHLVSPSRRQISSRPPMYRKARLSTTEKREQHPSYRDQPGMTRNPLNSPRVLMAADIDSRYHGSVNPLNGHRKMTEPDQHPSKLYSCKLPAPSADRSRPRPNHDPPAHPKNGSLGNEGRLRNEDYGKYISGRSGKRRFNTTYPTPELIALKASSMSASFPSVNQEPVVNVSPNTRPVAATLANRSSKLPRVKLKRTKSHEDHAYVNIGGSYFDDLPSGRSRHALSSFAQTGLVRENLFNKFQVTPLSDQSVAQSRAGQQITPSRIGQAKQHNGFSNTRTDSQIMAEVLNSFPQCSFDSNTNIIPDDRHQLGTVYADMTIPTAFADELFGIWSLTPELDDDISPSQPRTPLMTPLKEEAKKANRKFIWGNSGTPSGSTSTSSFAAGWQFQDDTVSSKRRQNLSHQNRVGSESDDYVQMDKNDSDQPKNPSTQMSISDPSSASAVPPTSTVGDVKRHADFDNANDLGSTDDCKTLPLNHLNMSHLYLISGEPDKDSVNNNAASGLAGTDDIVAKITSTSKQNATTSVAADDIQNRNSTTAAFAIVLQEQKYWL